MALGKVGRVGTRVGRIGFGSSPQKDNRNAIQIMYDSIKSIPEVEMPLAVSQPLSHDAVTRCMAAMSDISLNDVGLGNVNLKTLQAPCCYNIALTELFHICIFVLPRGYKIPLHDHPNMTVISKVLAGSLKMRAFSLESSTSTSTSSSPSSSTSSNSSPSFSSSSSTRFNTEYTSKRQRVIHRSRLARLTETCIRHASDPPWLLTPSQSNIHEFQADGDSACVVLDVLMPPYDDFTRNCTFYAVDKAPCPASDEGSDILWLLTITDDPEDLPVTKQYCGLKPVEN